MIVWVVIGTSLFDDSRDVLGVFSTLKLAEAYRNKPIAAKYDYTDIETFTLDEEE